MSDLGDLTIEVLLPIFFFVFIIVGIIALAFYILPEDGITKHAGKIYCETTKPSGSFIETETCFTK